MTQNEFNTLKDLLSKNINNSHSLGLDLENLIKEVSETKDKISTLCKNQDIINKNINILLEKLS